MSPHSRFNIKTLLEDLSTIEGEVICIFNSPQVFAELRDHPRIDKYCFNKFNAGVSRSWNLGINLAEGRTVFIMNADLHVLPCAIMALEQYLHQLPDAVLVGPQGSYLDLENLRVIQYFQKGAFSQPVRTHDVSGFFFALHPERFSAHKLCFDIRYSPCFMEEWDMAMQVMKAGLCSYTVPVLEWEHEWGISGQRENTPIRYFGRTVMRNDVLAENRKKFLSKWFGAAA
jgi:GT2 family glycosyltransferase